VTGIEVNPEAAAKARLYCQRVICGDAEKLDYAKELDGERFDVVLFADVLEHLKDPSALLRRIRDFIESDGYVVASIPNIGHAAVVLELLAGRFAYRPFGLLDNTHIRFFNRRSIYETFEATGYVIEELSRIEVAPCATESSRAAESGRLHQELKATGAALAERERAAAHLRGTSTALGNC
jgi:2-polyprenyl-3-methyl-5-hydroxy-6-metoxy-1,4-benzoquinol methylase